MSDFWKTWWSEKKEALVRCTEFQKELTRRHLKEEDWLVLSKTGIIYKDDWRLLQKFYEGLEKWSHSLGEVPCFIWEISGEFSPTGILISSTQHKQYIDARLRTVRSRALMLGWAEAKQTIWDTGTVFVVEGVFDYYAVRKFVPNVVAALTNTVGSNLAQTLSRYASVVGLTLDNDEWGERGTSKSKVILEQKQVTAIPVKYPYKDPGKALEVSEEELKTSILTAQQELTWAAALRRV